MKSLTMVEFWGKFHREREVLVVVVVVVDGAADSSTPSSSRIVVVYYDSLSIEDFKVGGGGKQAVCGFWK